MFLVLLSSAGEVHSEATVKKSPEPPSTLVDVPRNAVTRWSKFAYLDAEPDTYCSSTESLPRKSTASPCP